MYTEKQQQELKPEVRNAIRAGKIYGVLAIVLIAAVIFIRHAFPELAEDYQSYAAIPVTLICLGIAIRLLTLRRVPEPEEKSIDSNANSAFIADIVYLLLTFFITVVMSMKPPQTGQGISYVYIVMMLILPIITGFGWGFARRRLRACFSDERIVQLRLQACRIGYLLAALLMASLMALYVYAPSHMWVGLCWALFINAAVPTILFHISEGRD